MNIDKGFPMRKPTLSIIIDITCNKNYMTNVIVCVRERERGYYLAVATFHEKKASTCLKF